LILDALDELMVGARRFVIAHRLSTVRHADLIVVVNDGRVVEQGSHAEAAARRRSLRAALGRARSGADARGACSPKADSGPGLDELSTEIERIAAGNGASHDGAARLIVAAITPLLERSDDTALRSSQPAGRLRPARCTRRRARRRLLDDLVCGRPHDERAARSSCSE